MSRPVRGDIDSEVERRLKEMREDELVDFIRDTITQLGNLADRLETYVDGGKGTHERSGGTESP